MLEKNFKLKITFIYLGISLVGTLFALFIFNRFTPLIDSENYINGYYLTDLHFRTRFVQHITSAITSLTNPLITHLTFSLFPAAAIFFYALKSRNNSWLLLILLLPSSLVWTSIVGKEAIYFGCVGFFLILWIDLIKEKISYRHLLVIIPFVICALLRPHYTVGLLWLAFSAFVLQKNSLTNSRIVYAVIIIIFFILIIGILNYLMPDLAERGIGAIDRTAKASRNVALNIISLKSFISHLDTGMLFGIVGPFPSELLHRPEFIPFFIEGIIILISPLIIGIFLFKKTRKTKNNIYILNFIYGVVPAIIIVALVHAPFGVLNPGSAIRWRVNFELIFYMAPLLLFLEAKKNDY